MPSKIKRVDLEDLQYELTFTDPMQRAAKLIELLAVVRVRDREDLVDFAFALAWEDYRSR